MKITKDELITKITEKTEGMSKAQVNSVVTATFNTIADIMAAGDKISVPQFGTFGSAEHRQEPRHRRSHYDSRCHGSYVQGLFRAEGPCEREEVLLSIGCAAAACGTAALK